MAWYFRIYLLAIITLPASDAESPFQVNLAFTSEIRGAIFPVDKYGTQCSVDKYSEEPCDCYGGAARRQGALDKIRLETKDLILLDSSAYFYGSGIFFRTFGGRASADFFAMAKYNANGLGYRDFSAAVSISDSPGTVLSRFIDYAKELDPDTNIPLGTNLNLSASNSMYQRTTKYTVHHLDNNRTVAMMSLISGSTLTGFGLEEQVIPYKRALIGGLHELRQRPEGPPDVIVVILNSVGALASQASGETTNAILDITQELTDIDAFLIFGQDETKEELRYNWAGEPVYLFYRSIRLGTEIHQLQLNLNEKGLFVSSQTELTHLDCNVPENSKAQEKMMSYITQLQKDLSIVEGYLSRSLNGEESDLLNETIPGNRNWCTRFGTEVRCGCRVSQCSAGGFIANVVRWYSGANLAIINGGSIRSSLSQGNITRQDIQQLLPFHNEMIRLENIPTSTLREILEHSLSLLEFASGQYLQISSTLRFQWWFQDGRPTVGNIEIASNMLNASAEAGSFQLLQDSDLLSIATTTYLSNGGDGYSMLTSENPWGRFNLAATEFEAIQRYLHEFSPNPPGVALNELDDWRIQQMPDILGLDLAAWCCESHTDKSGAIFLNQREECHHIMAAIEVINDKEDGIFDDTLPFAVLSYDLTTGSHCRPSYQTTTESDGSNTSIVAIERFCTENTLESANLNAPLEECDQEGNMTSAPYAPLRVIGTQMPRTPQLQQDETSSVVYMSAIEIQTAKATLELMDRFAWRRIAIIHEDKGNPFLYYKAFRDELNRNNITVIVDISFSNNESKGIEDVAMEMGAALGRAVDLDSTILYTALSGNVGNILYTMVARTGLMRGQGYAHIAGYFPDDLISTFLSADGAEDYFAGITAFDDSIDLEMTVQGLDGVLTFLNANLAEASDPDFEAYRDFWNTAASQEACTTNLTSSKIMIDEARHIEHFCDADGDLMTFSTNALNMVDCVLLYAKSLQEIGQANALRVSPGSLYQKMINIPEFRGLSGHISFSPAGDRLHRLQLRNVRAIESADGTFRPDLVHVAEFYNDTLSLLLSETITFPGGSSAVPLDHIPDCEVNENGECEDNEDDSSVGSNIGYATTGVLAAVIVTLMGYICYRKYKKYKLKMKAVDFQEELQRLKEDGDIAPDIDSDNIPREIHRSCVKPLEEIGRGAFGRVFKGSLDESKFGGVPPYLVAIKEVENADGTDEFISEATIMALVSVHENILTLIGVVTSGFPRMMILPFCENGSLLSYLKKRAAESELDTKQRVMFVLDIARGMEHLGEKHNLVHRDLAARNVLVDSFLTCKIADFGLSRRTAIKGDDEDSYYRSTNGAFPVRWTAPESMEDLKFTLGSDVWSFGIVVIEIFQDGARPYDELDNSQVISKVMQGYKPTKPAKCPQTLYDNVLLGCWKRDPQLRPKFSNLIGPIEEVERVIPRSHTIDDTDNEFEVTLGDYADFGGTQSLPRTTLVLNSDEFIVKEDTLKKDSQLEESSNNSDRVRQFYSEVAIPDDYNQSSQLETSYRRASEFEEYRRRPSLDQTLNPCFGEYQFPTGPSDTESVSSKQNSIEKRSSRKSTKESVLQEASSCASNYDAPMPAHHVSNENILVVRNSEYQMQKLVVESEI
eukprot:m.118487 g.118487  ORF g.118487 m.118487 type:complete len:1623 (+) comp14278_c0_seq1:281-5149(+)